MDINWISVKDRFPAPYTIVLAYTNYSSFHLGVYDHKYQCWGDGIFDIPGKVTHWLPLPAPPEGEKTDG